MRLEITKKGLPALWEQGGGATNTGDATIIAGRKGEPLRPIYVATRGQLSCSSHALFVVEPGCYLVHADHHRWDFEISVNRVADIRSVPCRNLGDYARNPKPGTCPDCGAANWRAEVPTEGDRVNLDRGYSLPVKTSEEVWVCQGFKPVADTEVLCEFSRGEWDCDPEELAGVDLTAAIEAAKAKATCYHCREPHYIKEAATVAA